MNDFLKFLEDKIKKNIKLESILIIHKSFDPEKYHIRLEIVSDYLKSLDKIKAQRSIMNILSKELKTKIHALEIKII